MVLLFGASAAAWKYMKVSGESFVSGMPQPGLRASVSKQARRAFTFELVESDDHQGLKTEKTEEGTVTATTQGSFLQGNWNTVLGDQELPASGRSYWEVKFLSKPSDAWEYIGVAESGSDVTLPLTRNQKGKGYFMGANWKDSDSMVYQYLETPAGMADKYLKKAKDDYMGWRGADEKQADATAKLLAKNAWTGKGTHVGTESPSMVAFKSGTVVGIDTDMDKGTLSFWVDGKHTGPVRDLTGRPLSLKGKKLVPAMSIFGRDMGGATEFTKVEVRTGLEPPALP